MLLTLWTETLVHIFPCPGSFSKKSPFMPSWWQVCLPSYPGSELETWRGTGQGWQPWRMSSSLSSEQQEYSPHSTF